MPGIKNSFVNFIFLSGTCKWLVDLSCHMVVASGFLGCTGAESFWLSRLYSIGSSRMVSVTEPVSFHTWSSPWMETHLWIFLRCQLSLFWSRERVVSFSWIWILSVLKFFKSTGGERSRTITSMLCRKLAHYYCPAHINWQLLLTYFAELMFLKHQLWVQSENSHYNHVKGRCRVNHGWGFIKKG